MSIIWNTPVTPQGPTPSEMISFQPTLDSNYIYHDIGRGKEPYFDINNSRFRAANISWIELRSIIKNEMLSTQNDLNLIEIIKNYSLPYIPVRSGRLADTFFNNMQIRRKQWYSTHYVWAFGTEWSPLRPRPITGNVSKLGKGYGEHYIPTNPIPNRHLLYGTKGGNALYILDDPAAVNDPIPKIMDIANNVMEQEFHDVWDNTIITLHI